MTTAEKRGAIVLALVFFMRMLGLFMLVPVLALYAETLPGATPFLIGVAIGVYGLTQAVFQIPLGSLSDRIGRRPVYAGAAIFSPRNWPMTGIGWFGYASCHRMIIIRLKPMKRNTSAVTVY